MINKLVKIANTLDTAGHYDLANELDAVIKWAAAEPPCNCDIINLIGTGHESDCEYMAWKNAGKPEYKEHNSFPTKKGFENTLTGYLHYLKDSMYDEAKLYNIGRLTDGVGAVYKLKSDVDEDVINSHRTNGYQVLDDELGEITIREYVDDYDGISNPRLLFVDFVLSHLARDLESDLELKKEKLHEKVKDVLFYF
jgi:hypothetical protein